MQIPPHGLSLSLSLSLSLPANKIPEAMAVGANECLAARGTSVDHRGVFSSCVNRFYTSRNRAEYPSLPIPKVTPHP